jgi:hypothetical protein
LVNVSPPSKHRLAGGGAPHRSLMAPLTVIGLNEIRVSSS